MPVGSLFCFGHTPCANKEHTISGLDPVEGSPTFFKKATSWWALREGRLSSVMDASPSSCTAHPPRPTTVAKTHRHTPQRTWPSASHAGPSQGTQVLGLEKCIYWHVDVEDSGGPRVKGQGGRVGGGQVESTNRHVLLVLLGSSPIGRWGKWRPALTCGFPATA